MFHVADMKNTKKIAICGIISALSSVFMLASYFPYLTYAIPAIAGVFMMVPLIECGVLWALGTYVAGAVLVLIFGELEASVLFIVFFGYYPILKAIIERLKNLAIEWLIKFFAFNFAAILGYFIISALFSISFSDFGILGRFGGFLFLALLNIVFVFYDIGLSRVASYYMLRLHNRVKKTLK